MASVSHLDLLAVVDEISAAAAGGDVEALNRRLHRFRAALADHLGDEAAEVAALPVAAARVVTRGQRDLLAFVDELIDDTAVHSGARADPAHHCRCLGRAAELSRSVTRQARLEVGVLLARESIDPSRPAGDPAR